MPNYTSNFNLYKWDKTDQKLTTITETASTMDKIDKAVNDVKSQFNQVVAEAGSNNPEVVQARSGEVNLNTRLDKFTSQLASMTQLALQKVVQDMKNGLAVTIDCQGDSTYYGASLQTITTPPPSMLGMVLRDYYNNLNITVLNNGIPGNQTTNRLRTWDADMQASTAKVVYMNYGINDNGGNPTGVNDPAITAEQYHQNLRTMVTIARKYGKVVVLETPNPVMHYGNGGQGTSESVKQFSAVMRMVAQEMNCPLVDQHYWVEKYLSKGLNLPNEITDGIHPGQALYTQKGLNMASALISPKTFEITGSSIIPATSPTVEAWGGSNNSMAHTGSLVGEVRMATNYRIPIWVAENGLDIYIATSVSDTTSANCQIVVDGANLGTISLRDTNLKNADGKIAIDQEVMIIENATPGFHFIELTDTPSSGDIGLYYVRSYRTRAKNFLYGGSVSSSTRSLVLSDMDITATSSANNHVLTDIPVSRFVKQLEVEVVAQLAKDDGIILFHHKIGPGSGNIPIGGALIFLDVTTGYLSIIEGTETGYSGGAVLGNTDLSTAVHRYKITVSLSRVVTVFVDGTQIGTYSLTREHWGGFLGFRKTGTGTTRIDRVTIN